MLKAAFSKLTKQLTTTCIMDHPQCHSNCNKSKSSRDTKTKTTKILQPDIVGAHMKRNTSKQTRLSLQVHERGTVYQQLYAQPPKSFSSFNKELQSFLFRLTFCGNVYTDCVKCSSNSSYRITELNKLSQLEYIMLHIHRGARTTYVRCWEQRTTRRSRRTQAKTSTRTDSERQHKSFSWYA